MARRQAEWARKNAKHLANYQRSRLQAMTPKERSAYYRSCKSKLDPQTIHARSLARHAKRTGKLIPQPCRDCSATPSEMHHPDYQRLLDVVWLCRPCHRRIHRAVS